MTENDIYKFSNRVISKSGEVVYFVSGLMELLYKGYENKELLFPFDDSEIKSYNKQAYENYETEYHFPKHGLNHNERRKEWFYPKEYNNICLKTYFYNLLKEKSIEDNSYYDRVDYELKLYLEKDMENMLRFCIYFSDMIKKNDWVVSVGRGSSCCSLLLYLLEIHLIDPIKYELDIKEFLK